MHNLHAYAWGRHAVEPFDWAVRFERRARELMAAGEHAPAGGLRDAGPRTRCLSAPTPDHYLPLLYVLALQAPATVSFPVEGVDGGSISMLGVRIG